MAYPIHPEIIQLIQDFARELGDNIDVEDYFPVLIRVLREIELDLMHGHEDNASAYRVLLNDLSGEIQLDCGIAGDSCGVGPKEKPARSASLS